MTDALGMRRALPARMLPVMVAAMTLLAALALDAAVAAHLLAQRWDSGAGALVIVQVPDPDGPSAADPSRRRADAIMTTLRADDGLIAAHQLGQSELAGLLRPWLGTMDQSLALTMPAMIELRLPAHAPATTALAHALGQIAPGVLVEDGAIWSDRLAALTTSLQACAAFALVTVGFVGACVVALATRAGVATRRHAIEIVHGLGASDGMIAGRFARRAGTLTLAGGIVGSVVALPPLAILSALAAPFAASRVTPEMLPGAEGGDLLASLPSGLSLPAPLLLLLPALPIAAGLIGWITAQATVRLWLRRLP